MEEKKILTMVPTVEGTGEKALEGTEIGRAVEKLKKTAPAKKPAAGRKKETTQKRPEEAALEIKVDDRRRRVPVRNAYGDEIGVFYFDPADTEIVGRCDDVVEQLREIAKPIANVKEMSNREAGEAFRKAREQVFEAVDYLFNGNASEAFFGNTSPFSIHDGKFYFETVLEAVSDFIAATFEAETAKISERADSYLDEDE